MKGVFSRCAEIDMVNGNTFVIQRRGCQVGILEVKQLCVRKRCEVWLRLQGGVSADKENREWEVRG